MDEKTRIIFEKVVVPAMIRQVELHVERNSSSLNTALTEDFVEATLDYIHHCEINN